MAVARVYIVRHGETEENRRGIIQGHLDTQLNADGIEQARRVAEALRAVPFDSAISSDLSRAAKVSTYGTFAYLWDGKRTHNEFKIEKTAQAILRYHPDTQLRKKMEIRERFLGALQGLPYAARKNVTGKSTIEPMENMNKRALAWWDDAIVQYAISLPDARASNVLVVSHGGFIVHLVQGLMANERITVAEGVAVGKCLNTAVAIVEVGKDGKGVLVQYGNIAHLATKQGGMDLVQGNADEQ
ncbi:hypothetical protein EW146_g3629 [Bondarzewia mesenterica]|uniref:Phosphoglycerate mutase (2,3-diphosphoglycerate-dependent) n=1 Tax=Bondarzewia mesenterica TaxID=1095465 RepID=A0A4S4LYU6_9AGAM|nr:hypothetical protein EW146_g3629 [Bondarzewia mesenterica]